MRVKNNYIVYCVYRYVMYALIYNYFAINIYWFMLSYLHLHRKATILTFDVNIM